MSPESTGWWLTPRGNIIFPLHIPHPFLLWEVLVSVCLECETRVFWDRGPFKMQVGLLSEQACKLWHSLAEGSLQHRMLGKILGTKKTFKWQELSDRHGSYLAGSLGAHLTHNLADDLELFCSLMPFVLGIHGSVFNSFVALDSHLASVSDGVGDLRGKSTSHSKWHLLHPKRVRFRPTDTGFKAAYFRERF